MGRTDHRTSGLGPSHVKKNKQITFRSRRTRRETQTRIASGSSEPDPRSIGWLPYFRRRAETACMWTTPSSPHASPSQPTPRCLHITFRSGQGVIARGSDDGEGRRRRGGLRRGQWWGGLRGGGGGSRHDGLGEGGEATRGAGALGGGGGGGEEGQRARETRAAQVGSGRRVSGRWVVGSARGVIP